MEHPFSRTELLLGTESLQLLQNSRVLLFGVGGVGGFTAEALARCGVGAIDLVDNDTVSLTNLNRQIIALHSTIGKLKVEVMRDRILDINPNCKVTIHPTFVTPENIGQFVLSDYAYVVDAIDTVSAKLALITAADAAGTPILSVMGAGNKLDPTRFVVTDVYETAVCPLARVMRRELRKRNIPRLKVVYSPEEAVTPLALPDAESPAPSRRQVPGSLAFVPSVAGLIAAGAVVRDLIGQASPEPKPDERL